MAKKDEVQTIQDIVAYEVATPNPAFSDDLLTVTFDKGRAFVDEETAQRFQHEFPSFQVRPVTAQDMVQKAPQPQRAAPRPDGIAAVLEAAQGNAS